jgi:hypothetical protein
MNKITTRIIIVTTIVNFLCSLLLTLQLKDLKKRFVVLHDDFNLVVPKFSKDIWKLYKKDNIEESF